MTKQLVEGAKPYCLWQVNQEGIVYTMCDLDYHEPIEIAKDLTVCPLCDRPIRKDWEDRAPS